MVKQLLEDCFDSYHSMKLGNDCSNTKCLVPPECEQHNAVYNILHYLIDAEFIKINVSESIVFIYFLISIFIGNKRTFTSCNDFCADRPKHKGIITIL